MIDAFPRLDEVTVCSGVAGPAKGRPELAGALRRLAPDIALLHRGPGGLRWRSTAAALARESGLLYIDGGPASGATMLFVRMRVDTVSTWTRQSRAATVRRAGIVGGLLRCGGQLIGVVGGDYPPERAARRRYGEAVVDAVGELRAVAVLVVVSARGVGAAGDPAADQLTAAGLVRSVGDVPPRGPAAPAHPAVPVARGKRGERTDPVETDPVDTDDGDPGTGLDPGSMWTTSEVRVMAAGVPRDPSGQPSTPSPVGARASPPRLQLVRLRLADVP